MRITMQDSEIVDISKIKFVSHMIGNRHSKRFKGLIEKEGEKTCSKCGLSKLLNEYGINNAVIDGRHSWCRKCTRKFSKYYYAIRTKRTVEEIENKGKIINGKRQCSVCKQWKLINSFNKKVAAGCGLDSVCVICTKARRYKEARRIKLICMMGYGGCCQCCGERNIELLSVEHIRHRGFMHVRESSTLITMRKLIKLGFPVGHTCLCYNCNLSSVHIPCIHSAEHKKYIDKYIVPYPYSNQKELDELESKWNAMNSGVLL